MEFDKIADELDKNGFAVIKDFLTVDEVNDLKKRMQEILEALDPSEHQTVFSTVTQTRNDYFMDSADRISFFFEEGALDEEGKLTVDKHLSVNKIGHALHCQEPVFTRVTQSEKMKQLVTKGMRFSDPVVCQSMYIFKQPKIGGVVRPHQDSTFLHTKPHRLCGVWIPLEDALTDNGCLWFIPGSHKEGVHNNHFMVRSYENGSEKPTTTFTGEAQKYEDSQFVPVEMKAGSLVLIHGEVVHKSAPNLSTRSRHAYTFHVFDSDGVEYSKENWLQPTARNTFVHLLKS